MKKLLAPYFWSIILFLVLFSFVLKLAQAQLCTATGSYCAVSPTLGPGEIPMGSDYSQCVLVASPFLVNTSTKKVELGSATDNWLLKIFGGLIGLESTGDDYGVRGIGDVGAGGQAVGVYGEGKTGVIGQSSITGEKGVYGVNLSGTGVLGYGNTGLIGVGRTYGLQVYPDTGYSIKNYILGSLGVNISSPQGIFHVATGSINALVVNNQGNVGIGTTSPQYKLHVVGRIQATDDICTDLGGGVCLSTAGGGGISGSGSAGQVAFWTATNTISGDNGLYWDNTNKMLGIGTTPSLKLHVYESAPNKSGMIVNIATTSSTYYIANFLSNGVSRLYIRADGNVGIGTTNPAHKLHVASHAVFGTTYGTSGDVFQIEVLNSALTTLRFDADALRFWSPVGGEILRITETGVVIVGGGAGKIDVGTVDPIYTIGLSKYATYLPGMTGVKEETVGLVNLKLVDGQYQAVLDFAKADRGSDLWLFYQITDFGKNWENVMVLLSASFKGSVWYEKKPKEKQIIIYGDKEGEVSYRLTAPRFDWRKHPNKVETETKGFVLDEKE